MRVLHSAAGADGGRADVDPEQSQQPGGLVLLRQAENISDWKYFTGENISDWKYFTGENISEQDGQGLWWTEEYPEEMWLQVRLVHSAPRFSYC